MTPSQLPAQLNELLEKALEAGDAEKARMYHDMICFREDQYTILQWSDETFGVASHPLRVAVRMTLEVLELLEELGARPDSVNEMKQSLHTIRLSIATRPPPPVADPDRAAAECADVDIMLGQVCSRLHRSLAWARDLKMRKNRARTWQVGKDGVGQHVPDEND